jgi:hypothetical protein
MNYPALIISILHLIFCVQFLWMNWRKINLYSIIVRRRGFYCSIAIGILQQGAIRLFKPRLKLEHEEKKSSLLCFNNTLSNTSNENRESAAVSCRRTYRTIRVMVYLQVRYYMKI